MKETVDLDILITSMNGERKIKQPIRITSGPATKLGSRTSSSNSDEQFVD